MYKALIDSQSLANPHFLDDYQIVDTYEERWPGEDPEVLHMCKVSIPDEKISQFVNELSSKGLEEEWFTLAWSDRQVYVVFKDKVIEMQNSNPWNQEEYSKVVEYGKEHSIDQKYFLNMRSVMESW